ncbi:unnamed protein product [Amoebophrya sp. A25]|nr:unnamed protein product [Amoebophrya sp. A25]CAD7931287.1 unnamed protein product [Amoebophrya sp. A25]|eukprot:GSA25T00002960001.1
MVFIKNKKSRRKSSKEASPEEKDDKPPEIDKPDPELYLARLAAKFGFGSADFAQASGGASPKFSFRTLALERGRDLSPEKRTEELLHISDRGCCFMTKEKAKMTIFPLMIRCIFQICVVEDEEEEQLVGRLLEGALQRTREAHPLINTTRSNRTKVRNKYCFNKHEDLLVPPIIQYSFEYRSRRTTRRSKSHRCFRFPQRFATASAWTQMRI